MSGEFLVLDLPELRRRLEAHKGTRPTDPFGKEMQTWMKTKDRILFAIEVKEAEERQRPFYITVPPQPIERPVQPLLRLRQAKSSSTQEVRHADSPGKAGAPGALPSEVPMPRANPASHRNPQARIEHLVERIKDATRKGEKLYWAQQEVRDLCKAHNLEVPQEAIGRRCKEPEGALQLEAEGLVMDLTGHATPAKDLGKLPPPPFEGYIWFREMDRRLLDNLSHFRNSDHSPEEWQQIARDLAILETTAGAARQIAERHAEVA